MDEKQKAIDNAGHRQRVRERFKKNYGADMADYELLEFILTYTIPRRDVKPIAKALLRRFGNLGEILAASEEELSKIAWVKENSILLLKGIGAVWDKVSRIKIEESCPMALLTPEAIVDYCYANMAFSRIEEFRVIYFDNSRQYLGDEILWKGTINEVAVYPREIMEHCFSHKASRIVLIHNHPSDNIEPSSADIELTAKINHICRGVDIRLDDHIIIGKTGYYSFREHNIWHKIEKNSSSKTK